MYLPVKPKAPVTTFVSGVPVLNYVPSRSESTQAWPGTNCGKRFNFKRSVWRKRNSGYTRNAIKPLANTTIPMLISDRAFSGAEIILEPSRSSLLPSAMRMEPSTLRVLRRMARTGVLSVRWARLIRKQPAASNTKATVTWGEFIHYEVRAGNAPQAKANQ